MQASFLEQLAFHSRYQRLALLHLALWQRQFAFMATAADKANFDTPGGFSVGYGTDLHDHLL